VLEAFGSLQELQKKLILTIFASVFISYGGVGLLSVF
jgi:hypothetical protein